jgi:hypothetical protein
MGKIRPPCPKTGIRGLKGLEEQRLKREKRSSESARTVGLGERAQNIS